jgi:hypothetical protein
MFAACPSPFCATLDMMSSHEDNPTRMESSISEFDLDFLSSISYSKKETVGQTKQTRQPRCGNLINLDGDAFGAEDAAEVAEEPSREIRLLNVPSSLSKEALELLLEMHLGVAFSETPEIQMDSEKGEAIVTLHHSAGN